MKLDNKETCAAYGRRFGKARSKDVYCIEGESVTIEQMAQRANVDIPRMRSRLKNVRRRSPGAITWKMLGAK